MADKEEMETKLELILTWTFPNNQVPPWLYVSAHRIKEAIRTGDTGKLGDNELILYSYVLTK